VEGGSVTQAEFNEQLKIWLDCLSAIVGAVAWPIAATAIALIFKKQIADLLRKIRKLSWGDKQADFSGELDKVEKVALTTEPIIGDAQQPPPLPSERFQQLVVLSPAAAILDAWKLIELRLNELAKKLAVGENVPPRVMLLWLQKQKLITTQVSIILSELQKIRNEAAHSKDVSPTDAIRFEVLSRHVMRELEKL
jgi:hypothetical protein